MNYVVYLPATGRITQYGTCRTLDDARYCAGPGEAVIEADPDVRDDTHQVVAGKAVQLPEKPALDHTWDYSAKRWNPPAPEVVKAATDARLKRSIAAAEAAQARPLREIHLALATGQAPPAGALQRLATIDAEIAAMRQKMA